MFLVLFTYDLLLSVLVGGEQVDGLHLAEVDVVAEEEDEEQLAHILLLLVPVQRLVPLSREISQKSFLLETGPTLNFDLMLANSLFILFTSASLLLQFLNNK